MLTSVSKFYQAKGGSEILVSKIEESFERLKKGHVVTPISKEEEQELIKSEFVSDGSILSPFVVQNEEFYFQENFIKQEQIVAWIKNKVSQKEDTLYSYAAAGEFKKTVNQLFIESDEIDWQKIGAINCFLNKFSILSGSPGTGKTTTVANFLALFLTFNPKLKSIALVAQTAKAAARLNESLSDQHQKLLEKGISEEILEILKNIKPSTIHRLLKVQPGSLGAKFIHNQDNPLLHDIVLVDEASMVDLNLMHKLFMAIKPSTKVVLMGDKNQLSPVEAGSVFSDITQAMHENVFPSSLEILCDFGLPKENLQDGKFNAMIQLTKTYRFDGQSQIFDVSKDVLEQEFAVSKCSNYNEDSKTLKGKVFYLGKEKEYESILKEQVLYFKKYIETESVLDALKNINLVRILCATKSGPFGVVEMNKKVEQILSKKELIKTGKEFYNNQLIMITKNDYQLEIHNGDVGIVREEKGKLNFFLEDKSNKKGEGKTNEKGYRSIPVAYLENWEPAYAMTIHKSQGSEFPQVVICLPENTDNKILSKELLYTAITRSSNQVFLISDEEVLKACAEISTQKASGIQKRLQRN
jgi:exodeoxyribonuclease V alpha subunit